MEVAAIMGELAARVGSPGGPAALCVVPCKLDEDTFVHSNPTQPPPCSCFQRRLRTVLWFSTINTSLDLLPTAHLSCGRPVAGVKVLHNYRCTAYTSLVKFFGQPQLCGSRRPTGDFLYLFFIFIFYIYLYIFYILLIFIFIFYIWRSHTHTLTCIFFARECVSM